MDFPPNTAVEVEFVLLWLWCVKVRVKWWLHNGGFLSSSMVRQQKWEAIHSFRKLYCTTIHSKMSPQKEKKCHAYMASIYVSRRFDRLRHGRQVGAVPPSLGMLPSLTEKMAFMSIISGKTQSSDDVGQSSTYSNPSWWPLPESFKRVEAQPERIVGPKPGQPLPIVEYALEEIACYPQFTNDIIFQGRSEEYRSGTVPHSQIKWVRGFKKVVEEIVSRYGFSPEGPTLI